ncbi:MAG: hypothetical protein R2856_38445 [Caldilineaceae bacterium]
MQAELADARREIENFRRQMARGMVGSGTVHEQFLSEARTHRPSARRQPKVAWSGWWPRLRRPRAMRIWSSRSGIASSCRICRPPAKCSTSTSFDGKPDEQSAGGQLPPQTAGAPRLELRQKAPSQPPQRS